MIKSKGFTLIEIMVVIVIVGVLAAFALPAYQKYTQRAARAEGQQLAMSIMAAQERFYLEHAAYTDKLGSGTGELGFSKLTSESGHFEAEAKQCAAPAKELSRCVRVILNPKSQLAKDLMNDLKAAGASIDTIWLQSNGEHSDTWDAPIL